MTEPVAPTHEGNTFKVRDFIDAAQLKIDLAFSTTNLTDAMMQQASLFSHYGVLMADAARQVDVVKMLLENTEAAIYRKIRSDMNISGEKYTESLLDKMVSRDPRVRNLRNALTAAKRVESVCKSALEAFRHRRDMLVQLGLISREEMKGELSISRKNAIDEAARLQRSDQLSRIQQAKNGDAA